MTVTIIISFLFHLLVFLSLMFLNIFIKVDTNRIRLPASSIEVNIVTAAKEKPAKRRDAPPEVKQKQEKKPVETEPKLEVKSKEPEKKPKVPEQIKVTKPKVTETPKVAEKPKAIETPKAVVPEPVDLQKAAPAPVREVAEREAAAVPPVSSEEKTAAVQVAKLAAETPPISGPEVDIPDFKYDYYLGLIRSKVDSRWSQPIIYTDVKQTLIEFRVNRNGEIDRVVIAESSGDLYFDQSALRAVALSNPLPPLPRGYREGILKVRYRFIFGSRG